MIGPAPQPSKAHEHGWVMDLATKRIGRAHCSACDIVAVTVAAEGERKNLMDVMKDVREALEESAEAIAPAEADLRIVAIEEEGEHLPPPAAKANRGKRKAPASAQVHPSMKELGKEHRGY
jgi:hypothetical protein